MLLAILLPTHFAFAHVLKVDGTIGSTLHVDPADNPVVGNAATFYFEIKDKQNKFSPELCACAVVLATSEGEVVHTEQLFTQNSSAGLSSPLLKYVFPKGGVYTVILTGEPKTSGSFQPFKLEYTVRVENADSVVREGEGGSRSDVPLYAGLGAVVIIALIAMIKQRTKKSKNISALVILFGFVSAGNVLFYGAHFFELFTPTPTHRHVVGETGHADKTAHTIAPHTVATPVATYFVSYSQNIHSVVQVSIPVSRAVIPNNVNTRAPPSAPVVVSV